MHGVAMSVISLCWNKMLFFAAFVYSLLCHTILPQFWSNYIAVIYFYHVCTNILIFMAHRYSY